MKSVYKLLILSSLSILTSSPCSATHIYKESQYRDTWCNGSTEIHLTDGTRADCLTDEYAVEVEFAPKWAEAVGQSLHYADQTGKAPGILLIIEKEKDWRYYHRLKKIADKEGIQLWSITPDKVEQRDHAKKNR